MLLEGGPQIFFLFTTGPRVWALQLPSVSNKGPSFQTPYGKQSKARVPIFQLSVNFFHNFIPDGPRLTKSLHLRGFPSSLRLLLAMLSRFRLLLVVIIKIPRFLMKSGFQSFNFHFFWVQSPCFAMQNLSKARPQHLEEVRIAG
jgi:hypothetical protein